MPFYDYKCNKCGRKLEAFHGMNGKPAGLKCDFCGSTEIQRIFHPVGMIRRSGEIVELPSSGGSGCSSCSSGSCGSCGH